MVIKPSHFIETNESRHLSAKESGDDGPPQPGSAEFEATMTSIRMGEDIIELLEGRILAIRASISQELSQMAPIARVPNGILSKILLGHLSREGATSPRSSFDTPNMYPMEGCCHRDTLFVEGVRRTDPASSGID